MLFGDEQPRPDLARGGENCAGPRLIAEVSQLRRGLVGGRCLPGTPLPPYRRGASQPRLTLLGPEMVSKR